MKYVVCFPGSRNALIVIAVDEHPEIETIVVHDERSAAFYALGMALQLKAPVGVVCTSGSAMLNYYPAVAEAYYQCIPLVIMSADRPEEWVNHGDGQMIVQKKVYSNHIQFQTSISQELDEATIHSRVRKAFYAALNNWRGPIHFNLPLVEPLYGTREVVLEKLADIQFEANHTSFSEQDMIEIRTAWVVRLRKCICIYICI